MAIYYGSLPPDGDTEPFWVDTSTTPFKLMLWTGSAWCCLTTVETAVYDSNDVSLTDVPPGHYVVNKDSGMVALTTDGDPVLVMPCFTLGGGGGGDLD